VCVCGWVGVWVWVCLYVCIYMNVYVYVYVCMRERGVCAGNLCLTDPDRL